MTADIAAFIRARLEEDEEAWVPVPGYEGRWDVSSQGRVRSIPRRRTRGGELVLRVNKRGYLSVTLGREKHEVHRLVALAFLGPRPEGMEVRHLDGERLNCRVDNLAYGTRSENNFDRVAHGRDHNANKTHCPQWHAYTEENTRLYRGWRYCRACQRARSHPDYDSAWEA